MHRRAREIKTLTTRVTTAATSVAGKRAPSERKHHKSGPRCQLQRDSEAALAAGPHSNCGRRNLLQIIIISSFACASDKFDIGFDLLNANFYLLSSFAFWLGSAGSGGFAGARASGKRLIDWRVCQARVSRRAQREVSVDRAQKERKSVGAFRIKTEFSLR